MQFINNFYLYSSNMGNSAAYGLNVDIESLDKLPNKWTLFKDIYLNKY